MDKRKKYWVNWKLEKRGGKTTKLPYMPNGRLASSTDPLTWSTHAEVKTTAKKFSGIGLVITPEQNLIAIDIDHCLDKEKKITSPVFQKFVTEADTYTEISPSGDGLHVFLNTLTHMNLEAHRSSKMPGFECYSDGRYFTFTENIYENKNTVRTVSDEKLFELLSIVGYPWKEVAENTEKNPYISDEETLLRMFDSKNGIAIKKIWDGDLSEYNNDVSAADMALCMHLAFWTQKNPTRIESLWLKSPLGNRPKTTARKDYRQRTITNAIEKCSEIYTPPEAEHSGVDLMRNKKGFPFKNTENVVRLIRHDEFLGNSFRFNQFYNEIESNLFTENLNIWQGLQKSEIIFAMIHIQRTYDHFEGVTAQQIEESLLMYAMDKKVNPPMEYVTALEWDGEYRLDHWLTKVYGVPDDEYHSAVGANWLKGLVSRVTRPGCKFDYVLVLEGPQGWKKSTSLAVLGRGFHVETVMSPDNKDFYMLLVRNTIIEFSEGETLSRAEVKNLKGIITMLEDQFRMPYGRGIQRFPRHCVFAMTTNQTEYLKDETGNRRWLPVTCEKVADIDWLTANLDQLYAEAYHRITLGKETTWEFPEESMAEAQERRMIADPYEELLIEWYFGKISHAQRDEGITVIQAYQEVYQQGSPLGREIPRYQAMQIAGLLKRILKLDKKKIMKDGERANRWYPTPETEKLKRAMGIPIDLFVAVDEKF